MGTLSERRMAENEVVFRNRNEKIEAGFEELRRVAREDGQESMVTEHDEPLQFYCECSDEDCRQRIALKPSIYNEIHSNRRRFIIVHGHDTPAVEQVVETNDDYCVVEKFETPDPNVDKLSETPAKNA